MRTFIFGMLALLGMSQLSKADIVYDNLATGTPSSQSFGSATTYFAQSFTTTSATSSLDWIKINLLYPSGERPLDAGPEVIGFSRFSAWNQSGC